MLQVTIDNSRFTNNAADGVGIYNYTRVSIRDSSLSGNSNSGVSALSNAGSAVISMVNSSASMNTIEVQSGGGATACNIRLSGVSIFIHTTGLQIASNGTVTAAGNNTNTGSGLPNATLTLQ